MARWFEFSAECSGFDELTASRTGSGVIDCAGRSDHDVCDNKRGSYDDRYDNCICNDNSCDVDDCHFGFDHSELLGASNDNDSSCEHNSDYNSFNHSYVNNSLELIKAKAAPRQGRGAVSLTKTRPLPPPSFCGAVPPL